MIGVLARFNRYLVAWVVQDGPYRARQLDGRSNISASDDP